VLLKNSIGNFVSVNGYCAIVLAILSYIIVIEKASSRKFVSMNDEG